MAVVRPFRGIRYDPRVVGPLAGVVAPPYDVIRPEEQTRLYDASPYNVVRLDLGREEDRYGSAAATYGRWVAESALVRDTEPAFYVQSQTYRLPDGTERERWGFFARLRLEDFADRIVKPHEKTLASAKADRLELQRACRANLSSIFGLYSAPGWSLRAAAEPELGEAPEADVTDAAGVRHRLWRITDPAFQADLVRRLDGRSVYIADGHHRYETALRYRDEMRQQTGSTTGEEPWDFVLAYLANMDEPGLTVLPTHRLVRELPIPGWSLVVRLREEFFLEEHPKTDGIDAFLSALSPFEEERRIGLALQDLDSWVVLVRRDPGTDDLRPDVIVLHELVLEGMLGIEAHEAAESGLLAYGKDAAEAIGRVEAGEFVAAFLLNPTRVEEVRALSDAGRTMPEKSTYFYPKILTGLVFHSLVD